MKFLTAMMILALAPLALAQTTPKAGSPERKQIMDAVRGVLKKPLKSRPVIFKVTHLRTKGTWAFMVGTPMKPDGSAFDYHGTKYQQDINDDVFGGDVCALLTKKGGRWQVKNWDLGMTDVSWDGWWNKYGAPRSIFP